MIKTIINALALFVAVVFLQGCVSKASGVTASYVDPIKFKDLSCGELVSKKQEKANDLAVLSSKQDNARSRAIAYNLVLVVGSGALVKDRSDAIGIVKGEIAALESNIAQRCVQAM